MSLSLKLLIILSLGAGLAYSQRIVNGTHSGYTVAQLPAASLNTNTIAWVIDGNSASDCTTGTGAFIVACKSNGTVWASNAVVIPDRVVTPTFSAGTLTVTATAGNVQTYTLTANVTTITINGLVAGQTLLFDFVQATGPYTIAWPAAVHGGFVIGTTTAKHNVQDFYSPDGTNLYAKSPGVINQ